MAGGQSGAVERFPTLDSVFLTGGSGFLGSHLRVHLADAGLAVTLLARPGTSVETRPNETVCRGTLPNIASIAPGSHDAVVHLAAQTSVGMAVDAPERTWAVNATGTLQVLELARRLDADRVLYASTASVYGRPEVLPITEDHPTRPTDPYGASKLAGETLASAYHHTYDLPVVVARLFNTFGPRQPDHTVVSDILRQAVAGETVELGNLSPSRDFLYVADATRALTHLLDTVAVGETYNVASGEETTIEDLADRAIAVAGTGVDVVSITDRQRDEAIEVPRRVGDSTKLRATGWEPTYSLADGLAATLSEYPEP